MKKSALPLLAAYLAVSAPAVAQEQPSVNGLVEMAAGHQAATLDTKLNLQLTPAMAFFLRNRLTLNYRTNPDFFAVGAVTYQLVDGFAATAEADVTPDSVDPHIGLEYFNQTGNLGLYGLVNGSFINGNLLFLLDARFNPEILGLPAALGIETGVIVGKGGHQFSLQRGRAGVRIGPYQVGLFGDLTFSGDQLTPDHNLGAYARVNL